MINLGVLKNISNAKKYPKGAVIATGSMRAQMHIILKGSIGVYESSKKDGEIIASLEPGEFFGETAFFLEKDTGFTFIALSDAIVLPIYKHFITRFIKDEPEFCFELMKAMCSRLNDISAAFEEQAGFPWSPPESVKEPDQVVEPPDAVEAAPAPAAETPAFEEQLAKIEFSLFPEGHGSYTLPLLPADKPFLMEKSFTCPICRQCVKSPAIRPSKLITDRTDHDMRVYYQGVEPLYYEIITCPHCLYSALSDMFEKPDRPNADIRRELEALRPEIGGLFEAPKSPSSVFAGYYLALFCMPKCYYNPHLAMAKLRLKLHWIYQDCDDPVMTEKTAKQALDAYMHVYQNVATSPKIDQQLCLIIGELNFKLGNRNTARNFLLKAQSNREGIPLLRNKAADRIAEIREMGNSTESEQ